MRLKSTFLKKIGEMLLSTHANVFDRDPELCYFLLKLIGQAQYILPKEFV